MAFTKFSSSLSLIVVHCHPDCLTCSQSPEYCDLCQDPTKLLQNGQCVHSCSLGFYQAGALCLGMALGRQSRGGLRLTTVKEGGPCMQEMHNFQKPLEGINIIHTLLGSSTCRSLSSNISQVFWCLLKARWCGGCDWIFNFLKTFKDSNIAGILGVIYYNTQLIQDRTLELTCTFEIPN